jgi:hypothetical protein
LRREFLEHPHGPGDVTIVKTDHPEMEDGEVPSRVELAVCLVIVYIFFRALVNFLDKIFDGT